MTDRNLFEHIKLDNGIDLHRRIFDSTYGSVNLYIPFGSGHNLGDILPGSFHFLEHICCERSEAFPERHAFKKFIGLHGGLRNAATGREYTTYFFSAPWDQLRQVLPGFLSSVFNPKIDQSDIELQRTIIANERQMKQRWYPGNSELSRYISTQWQYDVPLPLEQSLGSDADLAQINVPYLQQLHQNYFNDRIRVAYVGPEQLPELEEPLAAIETTAIDLPFHLEPPRWINREYHVKSFRDVSRYQLYYGSFQQIDHPDLAASIGLSFILKYLTNTVHGPLFQWLREEKGWLYNIDQYANTSKWSMEWALSFPLSSPDQVEIVRQELWHRIDVALHDTVAIGQEVDRRLALTAYYYDTADDLLDSAIGDIDLYGRVIPESERRIILDQCRKVSYLSKLFTQYFNPNNIGSFCAVPED